MTEIRALVFDTFGTIVDWRGSIIAEGREWGRAKGIAIDWAQFADDWRGHYAPAMNRVRSGETPWKTIDILHREALETLLETYSIDGLTEVEKDHMNRVWHRLNPWPDSVEGLTRLKENYIISSLGNANVALLTNMAKHAGLPWDLVLSAELARHYKPDPEVYLKAAELLGLQTNQIMLVAAHSYDLIAARKLGLRTGFVYRPDEFGGMKPADKAEQGEFDIVAGSLIELAGRLNEFRHVRPILGARVLGPTAPTRPDLP